LETMDFRFPSAIGFGRDVKGLDTGGRG
jgi:hypothetical protein